MYLQTDDLIAMTPASSNGSSSATALPSHSVASSKSRSCYMPSFDIYDEPERGRSLSRSSSHSSSSGSSGVIVLPTPSSIDGQSSTGSHYPRSYGRMPPLVSAPYNPTYLYQVDGRSGFGSGTVQAQQSAVNAPSQAVNAHATTESAPKSNPAPLPVPLGDAWGLFRPRSPSSPRASSPGLFGPRSPRASSPGLFGPRSPPSVASATLPTLLHTPMSSITATVPVPVAHANAIPHPYSQHIDRQPPPTVSYYAYWPPMKVEQTPSMIPSAVPRIPVRQNAAVPRQHINNRSMSRSRSPQPVWTMPILTQARPVQVPHSHSRSSSRRTRSHSRPRPRSYSPASPIIIPPTPTVVMEPARRVPRVGVPRSRSRSHSAAPRSASPTTSRRHPPTVIVSGHARRSTRSRRSRSRSSTRSRSRSRSHSHSRSHSPMAQPAAIIIPPAAQPTIPIHPSRPLRQRSRSHSASSSNYHRSRNYSPAWSPASSADPHPIYIQEVSQSRSRSPRAHAHVPSNRRFSPQRPAAGYRSPIIIQPLRSHSRSRSRSPRAPAASNRRARRDARHRRGTHGHGGRRNYSPSTTTTSSASPYIVPSSNGPTVRIQEPVQMAPQQQAWWDAPPALQPASWPTQPAPTNPLPPWAHPMQPAPRPIFNNNSGTPYVPLTQPHDPWAQWNPAPAPALAPSTPWGASAMPVPAWGDDWEDDYIYPEFEYHHHKPHHHAKPAWMSETPHPKHARFHWVDGNITVVVGSVEYKLHRYLFKNSTWFFAHGSPTYLPMFGFAQSDFDRFLTVLYPQDYSEHECKTAEEWTSVLNVAAAAGMQDIRRLAIKQLTPLASPIEKIALGHRYDVKEWLGPAYLALAMRKEPISGIEGAKIGVEALVRVAALKDEVFANLTAYVDQGKFAELFAAKMAL